MKWRLLQAQNWATNDMTEGWCNQGDAVLLPNLLKEYYHITDGLVGLPGKEALLQIFSANEVTVSL